MLIRISLRAAPALSGLTGGLARGCAESAADILHIGKHACEAVIGEVDKDAPPVILVPDAHRKALRDKVAYPAKRRRCRYARCDAEARYGDTLAPVRRA